jgi:hypothetical protein
MNGEQAKIFLWAMAELVRAEGMRARNLAITFKAAGADVVGMHTQEDFNFIAQRIGPTA